MRISVAGFIIITSIFFIECQKELSSQEPSIVTHPPSTISDSTTLAQYVLLHYYPTPDTFSINYFTYDNLKRIIRNEERDSSATSFIANSQLFFYTGSDTLPTKVILIYDTAAAYTTPYFEYDTVYLSYNSLGQRIRDSTVSNALPTFVNRYQYLPNRIILDNGTLPGASVSTFNVTYSNGNIVSQTESGVGYTNIYDNNPNPFYKTYFRSPLLTSLRLEENPQPNNTTETAYGSGASLTNDLKFIYIYKANGYPATVKGYQVSNPNNYYKAVFIYK